MKQIKIILSDWRGPIINVKANINNINTFYIGLTIGEIGTRRYLNCRMKGVLTKKVSTSKTMFNLMSNLQLG